jgi:putative addiction module component (TIGR02574 family)
MSQLAFPPPGFDELSVEEQLEYIQALKDHVATHSEEVPVPDWQRRIITERLAAHQRGEMSSRPWSEIREELHARLRAVR